MAKKVWVRVVGGTNSKLHPTQYLLAKKETFFLICDNIFLNVTRFSVLIISSFNIAVQYV